MRCSPRHRLQLAAFLLFAWHARAFADTDDARAAEASLYRGQAFFDQGRYDAAVDELQRGYAINPQPRFLYSLGQAYRLWGRCADAVREYRAYLATHPTSSQVEITEQNILHCAELDPSSVAPPEAKPATPAVLTPPTVVVLAEPTAAPKKPRYRRWWLWTTVGLVAGVGVGLGVGLGLGLHHTASALFHTTLPPIGRGVTP